MLHISCRTAAGHHMQTPISLYHQWLHDSVYEQTCMRRSHTLSGVLCSGQPGPRRTHKGCHCLQQGTGNRLCLDYCACVHAAATHWHHGAGVLPVNWVSKLWFFKANKHHVKEIINLGFYHMEAYCDRQTLI